MRSNRLSTCLHGQVLEISRFEIVLRLLDTRMNRQERTYRLFDRTVTLRTYEQPGSNLFFFTMHDNEYTSVRAGRRIIRNRGGRLLELTHRGTRNISFQLGKRTYEFDPNRMFSVQGLNRSLREQSGMEEIQPEVREATRKFAQFVVEQLSLDERTRLCTLHNTTDDLTVESYLPGEEFGQNAAKVHVDPERFTTDFFLVTGTDAYEWLRDRSWNVVLQDRQRVDEDGSLSVRARDEGIAYINVEARLGHVNTQKTMIEALYEWNE